MTPGSTIGEADWAQCEAVIRRFEEAWKENRRPDIAEYVSIPTPHATHLLVELVHVDLDVRLRSGEDTWTEDYLERFPPLRTPERILDLLAAEYSLRARHRPPVWPEVFWLRFPEYTSALRARLPAAERPGWVADTRPHPRTRRPLSGPPSIPGYDVLDELGRGGMGVVYRASDPKLNRTVAVKTFATVPRPEDRARFAREAEAIARLDHPHIVPVYDVGEWQSVDGPAVPYFVMKWYSGGSLDTAPAGPGTPPAAQARAVELIARAVHHAHERGILHRDLKPSNILLDDVGRPHVADFGLAGRIDADSAVSGVVAGTPSYMAPEQLKDPKGVSVATDVYGLGAILYHQLTGAAPFAADSPLATFALVESAPAGPPSAVNPAVPADLDVITRKCLEKNPARRYANAAALADDLERWRNGFPITARPVSTWEHAWRKVRRHPLIAGLAASTLIALVTAVVVLADSNARIRAKEQETSKSLARELLVLRELENTLTREQRALYVERVASAGRLYTANQLPQAWAQLDLCPPEFRGWEWQYLNGLRNTPASLLTGHSAWVTGSGFLPDGRLVSVDIQGDVRIWDAARELLIHSWKAEASPVTSVQLHPTRNWIGIATHNALAVYDVDTGKSVAKPAGAMWVAFHPNGKLVATAKGPVIRLWSVPEWEPAGELRGHSLAVLSGAFHPDGKHLVTSSTDRTVRTWSLESRSEVRKRSVLQPIPKLVFSPDGKTLAECHLGLVLLTDPETGVLRDRIDHTNDERTTVAFHPVTHALAMAGANGEVFVWDRDRRRPTRVFRGHTTRIASLAFAPDGRLVSTGGDGIRIWDPAREQAGRTLARVGAGTGKLAPARDGTWLAVGPRVLGNPDQAWTVVLDAATGEERHRFPAIADVAIQHSTGHVASGRPEGGITLWSPVTGKPIWTRPDPANPTDQIVGGNSNWVAFSRDGKRLASWAFRSKEVVLRNPADGTEVDRLPIDGSFVYVLSFTPDGSRLMIATKEANTLWDLESRTRLPWKVDGMMLAAEFHPAGRWFAAIESDRTIKLRDARTGLVVHPFVGTATGITSLTFSPDGRRMATGGTDRLVRIWDVESGSELLALSGATEAVQAVAWDGTGTRLYALDDAVRFWSTAEK